MLNVRCEILFNNILGENLILEKNDLWSSRRLISPPLKTAYFDRNLEDIEPKKIRHSYRVVFNPFTFLRV